MLDPQTVQVIMLLVGLAFILTLILGVIYGLFLLAKIRTQAVQLNKRLAEIDAKLSPGSTSAEQSGVSL